MLFRKRGENFDNLSERIVGATEYVAVEMLANIWRDNEYSLEV
jgi:hypothetical protein